MTSAERYDFTKKASVYLQRESSVKSSKMELLPFLRCNKVFDWLSGREPVGLLTQIYRSVLHLLRAFAWHTTWHPELK